MKKIFFAILLALFAVGCTCNDTTCKSQYNANSSFNQETYVWESIYFPTNRTSGAK